MSEVTYISLLMTVCALVSIFIWFKINRWAKRRISSYFSGFPTRRTNYASYKRNFDLACVGGGECVGCLALSSVSSLTGYNWGLPRQTLRQSFWIAKSYFSLVRRGGKFLIFVTPSSFLSGEEKRHDLFRYSFFLDRNFLRVETGAGFELRDWLVTNLINYRRRDRIYEMASARFPLLYPIAAYRLLTEIKRSRSNKRIREGGLVPERRSQQTLGCQSEEFSGLEGNVSLEKAGHANAGVLVAMIEFLRERGLTPVIVIPPAPVSVTRSYPQGFLDTYFYPLVSRATVARATVLDYSKNDEFSSDSLYIDRATLMGESRTRFTLKLLEDLALEHVTRGRAARIANGRSISAERDINK